jgi:hypothetical protein
LNLYAPSFQFLFSVALFPATKPKLEIQICFYPFFSGGFYLTGPHGPLNRGFRTALWFIDFRARLELPGDYERADQAFKQKTANAKPGGEPSAPEVKAK